MVIAALIRRNANIFETRLIHVIISQNQSQNQRPRLRRNTLFLGRKVGGGERISLPVPDL